MDRNAALAGLCVAMFANSYALTNPMPYAGFMVVHFGVAKSTDDAGYSAGLIMTSFMAGRFLSSFYCGWLSDRISRKFVIRAGVLSCGAFQLWFGLATSFRVALVSRFLMGLFNGMTGVAKATIPELVPASAQQTAMGWISAIWGVGLVVGPAAGGMLEGRAFPSHPYLLPNLVGSAVAFFAWIVLELFLPGTRASKTREARGGIPYGAAPVIGFYCVYSLLTMAFDETLPLWLLAPVANGGAGLPAHQIGGIMAAAAVGATTLQITVFPTVSRRINPTRLFATGCLCFGLLATVPAAMADARWNAHMRTPRVAAVLIAANTLLRFTASCAYTAIFVCTNNAAPTAIRGTVNGLSMTLASLFKAVGPSLGTAAFAWSLTNDRSAIFGVGFLFRTTAISCLALAALAPTLLPAARYDEPPDDDDDVKGALTTIDDDDDDHVAVAVGDGVPHQQGDMASSKKKTKSRR